MILRPVQSLVFIVCGVLLFSGCVGGGATNSAPSGGPMVNDPNAPGGALPPGSSGVRGSIISEELFPVGGATIVAAPGLTATSDQAGHFELALPAGSYVMNITADGYEPKAQKAEVQEGQVAELQVIMKGIPGKAPYTATYIHVGFDACSFSGVYSAGPLGPDIPGGCPLGQSDTSFKVEVGKDWRAGVHELEWKSSEDMIFASSAYNGDPKHGQARGSCQSGTKNGAPFHDWCPAMVWGQSPLRILVRPNDTEYAKKYAIDGKETWPGGSNFTSYIFSSYSGYGQKEVNQTANPACVLINRQFGLPESWGCPFGVGFSQGIKITYYHTMFYLQDPPVPLEQYSAIPDK